jgi:hypothetical protein
VVATGAFAFHAHLEESVDDGLGDAVWVWDAFVEFALGEVAVERGEREHGDAAFDDSLGEVDGFR